MGLLDLFDRIFVVNLPSRSDRQREMRETFSRVGLDPDGPRVTWFPAIDPRTAAGFQNPGVRGCFLSHIAVLNMARNAGCRRVLLLEDDCEFADDFPGRQAEVAGRLESTPWGIAYLGHGESVPGPPGLSRWAHGEGVMLAHCYAVAGDILPRLCPYLEAIPLRPPGSPDGGPMAFDGALSWFRRQNPDVETVLATPPLAYQRSSRSDLSPSWFDRVPVLSTFASTARVLRRSIAGSY